MVFEDLILISHLLSGKENVVIGRRFGRITALSALYQMEVGSLARERVLKLDWVTQEMPDDVKDFIFDLVNGVSDNQKEIDELIVKYSKNWTLDRISPVEKSILRFSIYSLLYRKDMPANVVIDEAIEISKLYSTEKSYQFINGILDGINKKEIKKE